MVFEPNFTKVVSSARRNIGITQSVIELKLPTNDNVEVSTIYSIGANSTILSSEIVGKDINFMGLVDFQAIYNSDGVNAIDYSAEFKDKFVTSEQVEGELVVSSNVIDVTSNVVSGGIRVVAIIEITIDEIVSSNVNALTSVNSQDIFLATRQIEYSSFLGKATEKFEVTGDFQIKDVSKILMFSPCVTITKVEPKENYLVVTGVMNADVCYQAEADGDNIKSCNHNIDFSWEVALNGVMPTSIVQSELSTISNEIKVSTTIEDNNAIVNLFVPVVYVGFVFNRNNLDIVDDVYLEKNYLSVTTEQFETLDGKPSVFFRDNISGSANILDSAPFIDDILGVCTNNIVLASSNVDNDKLTIEGIANASVVYYTKETNSITSVQVEMPFSVEQKVEGENSSVVSLCIADISARSKRGKEIEVSAELNVYSDMYSLNNVYVISNIALGDEKPQEECSLFIYIVKPKQTLWDIAKEMSVSDKVILEQNPEVQLPLVGGEKLVVYKPKIIEY